jgi:hypothetical protein
VIIADAKIRPCYAFAQEYLAQIEAFSCGSAGWRRSFLLT